MGCRSRVRGVLGSPLPKETTGERPPSAGNRILGRWIVSGLVGRSGSGLRVTGLPEIGSPCSLRRVSSLRIHRILPSHSRSLGLPLSHALCLTFPLSLSISLSFPLCGLLGQKNKEERKKKNMKWACSRGCAGEEEKKRKEKKKIKNKIR
jgi:hypothetical protein